MPDSKKIVLKVGVVGDGCKAKAMSIVAKFQGVKSMAVDGDGTLTVVGEVDVVRVAKALRKAGFEPRVVSVGPEKPPENKEPPKTKPDGGGGEDAKKPPPCCPGCSACCCPPVVPFPAAHPFPGAVVCYEEQAAANGCVIL